MPARKSCDKCADQPVTATKLRVDRHRRTPKTRPRVVPAVGTPVLATGTKWSRPCALPTMVRKCCRGIFTNVATSQKGTRIQTNGSWLTRHCGERDLIQALISFKRRLLYLYAPVAALLAVPAAIPCRPDIADNIMGAASAVCTLLRHVSPIQFIAPESLNPGHHDRNEAFGSSGSQDQVLYGRRRR